jgi:nucleotide-binding universal stress UspA family protein
MRVLCCLDGANLESVLKAMEIPSPAEGLTVGLLHVIDIGPRKDIAHTRERFFRPHILPGRRDDELRQADKSAASSILKEGLTAFSGAEIIEREGRPEREIITAAKEWKADLIVICAQAGNSRRPDIGPKSVGHVARFVLDHAPCAVLLVRVS